MSDRNLRELERRWRESGAPEDEAAYLLGRVRAGDLSWGRLELAARCGSVGARLATGLSPSTAPLDEMIDSDGELDANALTRVAAALATVAYPIWRECSFAKDDDPISIAFRAVQEWRRTLRDAEGEGDGRGVVACELTPVDMGNFALDVGGYGAIIPDDLPLRYHDAADLVGGAAEICASSRRSDTASLIRRAARVLPAGDVSAMVARELVSWVLNDRSSGDRLGPIDRQRGTEESPASPTGPA